VSSVHSVGQDSTFIVCAHIFSFRAARTDDVPVDSSIPSPKKTKSLRANSRARPLSEGDESVTCGES